MMVNWATAMFSFYLVTYTMKYFNGSVYQNMISGTFGDLLSCFFTARIMERFGVKTSLLLGYFIGCGGMLSLLLYDGDWELLNAALVFVVVFGNAMLYTSVYAGNQVVFDIRIMSATYSVCNLTARSATILAPQVAELKPDYMYKFIYLGAGLIGAFSSLLLRENRE